MTAIKALAHDRLDLFVGVDDAIVEAVSAGAVGWVAGLVNALPKESVDLFNYAAQGETEKALKLYHWFLSLLRLDTVPKFVQCREVHSVRPKRWRMSSREAPSS